MDDAITKAKGESDQNWSPIKQISPGYQGYLGAGGVRTMATEGDTVHLVFWDGGIHYLRSEDAGRSWGPKTLLAKTYGSQAMPSIHRAGSRLHVIWQDGRDSAGEQYAFRIYHKHSDDGGRTWGPDVRISSKDAKSFRRASTVSGKAIHAVWADKRFNTIPDAFSTDGNWEIYYKRSLDSGESWGPDVRLTDTELVCQRPVIGVLGDTVLVVWVAWEERGRGTLDASDTDIYYIRSTDNGETWGPVVRMTDTPHQTWHPQLVTPEPGVFGVFQETGRTYDFETERWGGEVKLLFTRSTDGGQTWDEPRQINDMAGATHALVCEFGAHVHVTWTDEVDGRRTAMYAFSPDSGATWGAPECLTSEGEWFAGPPGATADRVIVTMNPRDRQLPQTELYYRTRAVGLPGG